MKDTPARGNLFGNWLPARYVLAVMGSIGMAIIYGLKVNLSVAMVAMLNHTALKALDPHNSTSSSSSNDLECEAPIGTGNGTAIVEDGPFIWGTRLQGTLLSCYFWGYLISQVPGARVAENFSAKWVMLFSVAINVACTILTPVLTYLHYSGLIVMRVLEGIGGGATFPAMHCLIASWAPPDERSVISTVVYVGTSFGTAVSIMSAGIIAASWGWESVFYIMGGLSCIWMIVWTFLIQDSPNKQPFISLQEREMINSKLGKTDVKESHPPTPWAKVFSSLPFWAILISHVCSNWGWYMFLIETPLYMKHVLHFDVASNAVASALPYFPMLIFSVILGKTLDTLKSRNKMTTTIARKIATGFASVIPAICLVALCYIGCRHTAAVAIMTIGIVSMGGMFSGFLSNHIDIAPNFAGTLVALTNTVATLPGIIVPLFVGAMTEGNQTISAWRVIFWVTIVLFSIEIIVFASFGCGEEQSWNRNGKSGNEDSERLEKNEFTPLKMESSPNKTTAQSEGSQ